MTVIREKTPAYKEPWFWAVLGPLLLVIAVCSVFVTLAFVGADDRVYDDYYKQGRMINNQFASEEVAVGLGVEGELKVDVRNGEIWVNLDRGADTDALILAFSHPSQSSLDFKATLVEFQPGQFRGALKTKLEGRWYVILTSAKSSRQAVWRVSTELDLSHTNTITFRAHP